ncbi:putative hydro-lyase [uncultured Sulfitobacter sp.]|uniref:putative hydro-lyase n=1 Tax=uncultured Sulfitobacter sp. TaxID=191468 RepID=UPI00260EAD95|nr:putative hydro-lyase [uncultured Sulfitobacter sp.]
MTKQTLSHSELIAAAPEQVRSAIRHGTYNGHTAGLAAGKLQCNLAILPERFALDFLRFCQRNPKPCPVVGVSDSGNPNLPTLGRDIDIRTDVSQYRVFKDGVFIEEVADITALWADDLVTVALGCSFTFENALLRNNIPVRHIETGRNVPMYRSNIDLMPAGPFAGKMVVTMRPIPQAQVEQARKISARYPHAHGAPIGFGDPSTIGIDDLALPDWGDAVEVKEGEVPVYWACGVTPQNVLLDAQLPLCITHSPGHMLIADVAEDAETTILPPQ